MAINILMATLVSSLIFLIMLASGAIIYLMFKLISEIRRTKHCEWTYKNDDPHQYNTGCENKFYNANEDGDYVTSWLNFCPYCGKDVIVKELQ